MPRARWCSSCEPAPPWPPPHSRLLWQRYQNTLHPTPSAFRFLTRRTHPRACSGLVAGTGCIICSKTLFELKAVGISGVEETFEPQVFQPFVMFFGMLFALPMYLALEARKRIRARSDPALRAELDAAPPITVHPRLEPSLAGADAREP